jgi:hydrogenase nickel incorporation protein HypB
MKIKVMNKILAANDAWAAEIKQMLKKKNILMINLIGSPGAGKTSLLEATLERFKSTYKCGVIEGDIATTKDAERIQKKGVPVFQINTGTACHLDAHLVHAAIGEITKDEKLDIIFVENIGNLVCPAEFDIGEHAKVAILSVTEGDDKIEKYPLLFSEAKALIVSKMSLLEHTNFNYAAAEKAFRIINPRSPMLPLDSLAGTGLETWIAWMGKMVKGK